MNPRGRNCSSHESATEGKDADEEVQLDQDGNQVADGDHGGDCADIMLREGRTEVERKMQELEGDTEVDITWPRPVSYTVLLNMTILSAWTSFPRVSFLMIRMLFQAPTSSPFGSIQHQLLFLKVIIRGWGTFKSHTSRAPNFERRLTWTTTPAPQHNIHRPKATRRDTTHHPIAHPEVGWTRRIMRRQNSADGASAGNI